MKGGIKMTFGLLSFVRQYPLTDNSSRTASSHNTKAKPFLQWVGGKREMIEKYPTLIPQKFNSYHEPFLGGGAMMFHVAADQAFLSDYNSELIATYKAVASNVNTVISILRELKKRHSKELYLAVRSIDRSSEEFAKFSNEEIAARLIYLNQTGFNGVYRVNKKGQYNVPIGSSLNRLICDEHTLKIASKFIKNYSFSVGDFSLSLNNIKQNDFLYLDPPYDPVSEYSDFTRYTKAQFGVEDQQRVFKLFEDASLRGCLVMLSNSDTELIRDLYKQYNIYTVHSSRNLNSDASKRGNVNELAITNYKVKS
jgi:DNA adenine methylase